jgi:microcystin-dependent protein
MNQANPHAHLNAVRAGSSGASYYRIYDRFANESNTLYTENTDINHTHNIFINNVAGGSGDGTHNNMQPSIGLNFIIKT